MEAGIAPFRIAVEHVTSIPGISDIRAQVIVSEIGTDMSRFPRFRAGRDINSWAESCQQRESDRAPVMPIACAKPLRVPRKCVSL